jgi:hypothetical protein
MCFSQEIVKKKFQFPEAGRANQNYKELLGQTGILEHIQP